LPLSAIDFNWILELLNQCDIFFFHFIMFLTWPDKYFDNSKRNETPTGCTQYHDFRTEVDIFGNKDNRDFDVNTDSTGYRKR
jgi:hypothetical protein